VELLLRGRMSGAVTWATRSTLVPRVGVRQNTTQQPQRLTSNAPLSLISIVCLSRACLCKWIIFSDDLETLTNGRCCCWHDNVKCAAAFTMQDCCDLCRRQNEPGAICDIAELWHTAGSKTGETDHRRVAFIKRPLYFFRHLPIDEAR
jgi:hypothetical protein